MSKKKPVKAGTSSGHLGWWRFIQPQDLLRTQQTYLYPDSALSSADDNEKIVQTYNKKTEVKSSYKYKTHTHMQDVG